MASAWEKIADARETALAQGLDPGPALEG
jgi:hypothetical protein